MRAYQFVLIVIRRLVVAKRDLRLAEWHLDFVEMLRLRLVELLTSDVKTIASIIMRTTLNIDDPVLKEVKVIHKKEGRSMGAIVSELLAEALLRRRSAHRRAPFGWTSREMNALVDLADKDAVYAALDADRP